MASLIDNVRTLHAPVIAEVDGSFDIDVICRECTDLIASAHRDAEDKDAADRARIIYPCQTASLAHGGEDVCAEQVTQIRTEYFDKREAELREELDFIEAIRTLNEPEPELEKPEPEPKEPARKAAAKKSTKAAAKKGTEPEPAPEPEDAPESDKGDVEEDWVF